jgi:5-methyltetrahydrofolate--homocysteine methyltransferase
MKHCRNWHEAKENEKETKMIDNLDKIMESILNGNGEEAIKYTKMEMDKGTSWSMVLEKAMIPAMEKIGADFSKGTAFLPELIAAGYAMSKAVEVFKSRMADPGKGQIGTVVMGTIFGDVHDIGKNIVKICLEGAGFRVIDLGTDVQPEAFIEACRKNKADLVGISALLSSTMLNMETAIKRIREEKLPVKIMIGGAPLTEEFAAKFGADGYAPDAYLAARKAKELLGKK